jgi:hypothetical protein
MLGIQRRAAKTDLLPGFTSVDEFELAPEGQRQRLYKSILTSPGFLQVKEGDILDSEIGQYRRLFWVNVTGSDQTSEEALRVYYSQNYFRVLWAPELPSILNRRQNIDTDPWGGPFQPRRYIRRISLKWSWKSEVKFRQYADGGILLKLLNELHGCPQLEEVTLELGGVTQVAMMELQTFLDTHVGEIRQLDRAIPRGVMVLASQGYQRPQLLRQRWWSDQKFELMKDLEEQWLERFDQTERVDYQMDFETETDLE